MSDRTPSETPEMDYGVWARLYDTFYAVGPENEVEFYLQIMRQCEPPFLEIAVGTGRVAIPAVEDGHRIVGIDLHQPMLAVARLKMKTAGITSDQLQLVQADMTDFDLGDRRFGLVYIPGNSLTLVLNEQSQAATVANAARHLTPDGVLALSVYNASDAILRRDDGERFLIGVIEDESTGARDIITGTNSFDTDTQINSCTQVLETITSDGRTLECHELPVITRYLTLDQATDMVSDAGLTVQHVYGDFDLSAYSETSDEMILVCRRQ